MEWTFTLAEIERLLPEELLEATGGVNSICIHGQMGAGKTTFIHHFAMQWG